MPYLGPRKERPFRKAGLKEGPRRLREDEYRKVFSTFSSLSSEERLKRFTAARAAVQALGGSADIVREAHGGLRLRMRLEFPTRDKNMDPEHFARVSGMGFELSLESRPAVGRLRDMERTYAVTEVRGGEGLEYAHSALERLLEVRSYMNCNVRTPAMAEVVPLPVRAAEPLADMRSADADRLVAMQR